MSKLFLNNDLNELVEFVQLNQKKFKFIISPDNYMADGMTYELSYAIKYLQSRMRAALFFFVNGSYWLESNFWKADALLTFGSRVDSHVKNILTGLSSAISNVHQSFGVFDELFHHLKTMNHFSVSNLEAAKIFSIFYREFGAIASSLETVSHSETRPSGILNCRDYNPQDHTYLAPLFELQHYSNRYFRNFLTGFYLHGSFATMDYISQWSDLDTLMIVNKETICNPVDLDELRRRAIQSHKYLYKIDPYQLHGHLLISEFDLDYFSETYFPSVLLRYSKSFFSDVQAIDFSIRDSQLEKVAAFWHDAIHYFFARAIQYKRTGRGLIWNREKKLFVHRLLTFPLFYLQAKGFHVYKKHSFDQAEPDFGEGTWQIIKEATAFMNRWKSGSKGMPRLKSVGTLNSRFNLLLLNIYNDTRYLFEQPGFKKFNKQYARWLESALALCSIGWNNVKRLNQLC